MAQGLAEYCQKAADTPFRWGVHDCTTFAGNYYLAVKGVDPMVWFRGRYSTEAEAMALLEPFGGLLETVGRQLTPDDVDPIIGVWHSHSQLPCCCIRHGRRWAVLTPDGVGFIQPRISGGIVAGFR